jgi:hypothetical protein
MLKGVAPLSPRSVHGNNIASCCVLKCWMNGLCSQYVISPCYTSCHQLGKMLRCSVVCWIVSVLPTDVFCTQWVHPSPNFRILHCWMLLIGNHWVPTSPSFPQFVYNSVICNHETHTATFIYEAIFTEPTLLVLPRPELVLSVFCNSLALPYSQGHHARIPAP